MLACISKNDRAEPLFAELAKLAPGTVRLGRVTPSRGVRLLGALTSLGPSFAQMRTDMEFSPTMARAAQRLTEAKLRQAEDVTHVLQWGAMYPPVQEIRRLKYSIVTDGPFDPEDGSYPAEWRPRRWASEYFARQRRMYREAALVFTLSQWARQKLLAVHDLEPARVVRIGWGPMFEAGPEDEIVESKLFVSVGNEWRRKGMDLVARAGARLHAEDSGAETVIAGDPEGMRLSSAKGVTLLPRSVPIDEVKGLLRRARALVVASRFDASPHIVMEALQMGVPVIASSVCGIPEAVQAPLGGVVVAANDEYDLLEAMREVLGGDRHVQRADALRAYAATGGWAAAAGRLVETMRTVGVL